MLIGSLLALALAAAEPVVAPAPPARDPDLPAGAPADDYGFVAWCHGALTGHMELREMVQGELDALSPGPSDDAAKQKAAGEGYLTLYTTALRAAERASTANIQARGRAARAGGLAMWSEAKQAEPRTRMWSYLNWELPGRCETTAKKLEERSTLFGQALRPDPAPPAPGPVATAQDPTTPEGLRGAQ